MTNGKPSKTVKANADWTEFRKNTNNSKKPALW